MVRLLYKAHSHKGARSYQKCLIRRGCGGSVGKQRRASAPRKSGRATVMVSDVSCGVGEVWFGGERLTGPC